MATKKILIQPQEVKVPPANPFANDRFKREETAKILTNAITSITGPCVLSVDAPWGAGKTTFLRMWTQYLRNEGFPVVKFNAWKTDFTEVPFIALSSELADSLQNQYLGKVPLATIGSMQETAEKVLKQVVAGGIRQATAGLVDINKALDSYAKRQLAEYSEHRELIKNFREKLGEVAVALKEKHHQKPLVVVIDELDRCRPSYAVEFLETAKHLFAVDNIVFVLAVNREQLVHSVRALYGNKFDAEKYLLRFFDLSFRLPYPALKEFITETLNSVDARKWFTRDPSVLSFSSNLLQKFFAASQPSARDIAQALHHIGAMFALLADHHELFDQEAFVLLILKTINQDIYYRFITGDVSDKEVVDAVFEDPELETLATLRNEFEGRWFETTMILATEDIVVSLDMKQNNQLLQLHKYYKDMLGEGSGATDEQKKHAEDILNRCDRWRKGAALQPAGIGFWRSIQRLEMLSPELLQQDDEPG